MAEEYDALDLLTFDHPEEIALPGEYDPLWYSKSPPPSARGGKGTAATPRTVAVPRPPSPNEAVPMDVD
jgi:hypothetical protein